MTEELNRILQEWQDKGFEISEDEVEHLLMYCNRKMDLNRIENREEYLPLLFADEVKNYLFRQTVNTISILRMEAKKCAACV